MSIVDLWIDYANTSYEDDKFGEESYQDKIQKMLMLTVPEKYKIVPSQTLYRGLTISHEKVEDIKNGIPLKWEQRYGSSWSTSLNAAKSIAINFNLRGTGIVISCKTPPADNIIFSTVAHESQKEITDIINELQENNILPIQKINNLKHIFHYQREVILKGSVYNTISKSDIIYQITERDVKRKLKEMWKNSFHNRKKLLQIKNGLSTFIKGKKKNETS